MLEKNERLLQDDDFEDEDGPLDTFLAEGLISAVLRPLRPGKEATVYLCRGNPERIGRPLVAAKVYHARERRNFRDNAAYKAGQWFGEPRDVRAMKKKTAHGRDFEFGWWVWHEYDVLKELAAAGGDVPAPLALRESAILMEHVGDEDVGAPQLREVRLDARQAREVFDRLLWNVELFLGRNIVHADLSAYNVLCWDGGIRVIDFPQAVDPRTNRNAMEFLERDLTNVCRFFERFGVHRDARQLARGLWIAWQFAEL